jgi:hypothetical protein
MGGLDLGPRSLEYDGEEMDLECVLDALFYGTRLESLSAD